jgi:UDP-glucose 4-epimerase
VVMSRSGDTTLIADVRDSCDIVSADVTDAGAVEEIIRTYRISHIVHLGAALPRVAEESPGVGVRINTEGTANVLGAAARNRVARVVMASSKAIYGRVQGEFGSPTYKPIPEDTPPKPATIYGISKLAAELLGRWYMQKHGLEVVALRFGSTIGPGKIARHGGAFSRYSLILEGAMAGAPVEISHGGDAVCDALFNDDAARGIVRAVKAPALKHESYNIATGAGFTLCDYAAAVKRRYPKAEIAIGAGPASPDSMNCILDVSRARQDLDFVVTNDLDDIVAGYIATMRRIRLAPAIPGEQSAGSPLRASTQQSGREGVCRASDRRLSLRS